MVKRPDNRGPPTRIASALPWPADLSPQAASQSGHTAPPTPPRTRIREAPEGLCIWYEAPTAALSSDPSPTATAAAGSANLWRRAREEAPGGATQQNSQLGLGPARNKTDNAWLAVLVSARARRRVLDVQRAASRDADGRRRRGSVRLRSVAFLSRRRFLRSPFPFVVAN